MRFLLSLLALCLAAPLTSQEVIITGVLDGTLSGGQPRAVELYVSGTVDLSGYTLNRYSNGNTSATGANTAALSGTYTDEFVYAIRTQPEFVATFGAEGDFTNVIIVNDAAQGTGDDVYTIESGGTIVDQAGGVIGERTDLYNDSWIYRNDNTGPDGDWVPANWANVGNNDALSGQDAVGIAGLVPFGTYSGSPAGPAVGVTANGDLAEPATNGGFTLSLSEAAGNDVTITYTLAGTATAGADYVNPAGTIEIAAGQSSAQLSIQVLDDDESERTETIELMLTSVSDAAYALGAGATISIADDEPVSTVLISAVQGGGAASPLAGQTITVEGIVVGDFQGGAGVGLGGFFIQEEDADADDDPQTSEGLWVFDQAGTTEVNVGDLVTVTGLIEEANDLTQIDVTAAGGSVNIVSRNNALPTAASLDLPVQDDNDYEAYEGMLTTVSTPLTITETFGIARFGEFDVVAGDRLVQFTECNEPDPTALTAYNAAQDLRRLTVDDGRSGDNAFPIVLGNGREVTPTNSLRSGASVSGLTGIIDERFTGYRMQATGFTVGNENDRPAAAPEVGGNITVVGMNVLNYFTTLGSRGADNEEEFDRQEIKIVKAICELNADVVGLVEIENNGYGANGALQSLIDAVAAECGTQYSFVTSPNTGTDQIQVALIYRADVLMESGTAAALSTPANIFSRNRVPLAQTFRVIEADNPSLDAEFTVCVNHWKSKGGSCGAGDDDDGGAGSCDGTRTAAATAIRDWLDTRPTGTDDPDNLIIGDLNAYSQEAPITTLLDAGYVNTVRAASPGTFPCDGNHSYVFRGQWGSLDHALASASLAGQVTGATPWAVNAAEPTALDYDTRFNDPALFNEDFYRFSDHDPVVVGLDLAAVAAAELLTFTGRAEGAEVVLGWATATERMTDRFEVQRMDDAGDFQLIGTVSAAGNSTDRREYTLNDTDPRNGRNDYRLRILDTDGNVTFSGVVSVNFEDTNSLEVRRTGPREFRLLGGTAGAEYLLTDSAGAVLRRGVLREELTDFEAYGLPAGVYFLTVLSRSAGGRTLKVVLP